MKLFKKSVPRSTRIKKEYLTDGPSRKHEDVVYRMDASSEWHERRLVLLSDDLCLTPVQDELIIEKIPLVRASVVRFPDFMYTERLMLCSMKFRTSFGWKPPISILT